MRGRVVTRKSRGYVWGAVQSSVGIGADLWKRSVRAKSVYPSVCTGIMRRVVRYVGVRGGGWCTGGDCVWQGIYTALSGWWRGGCVKFWVAAY